MDCWTLLPPEGLATRVSGDYRAERLVECSLVSDSVIDDALVFLCGFHSRYLLSSLCAHTTGMEYWRPWYSRFNAALKAYIGIK